jgi:hypothetical protein
MNKLAIETEVITEESRRDRRGRMLLSEERWEELLCGYEQSELTQRDYSQEHGINVHTFVARLAKRRREGMIGRSRSEGFLEAKLPRVFGASALEVALPNGLLVRGSEPGVVVEMVRALLARI